MGQSALIVIDAQGAMFAPSAPVYDAGALLTRLQGLIQRARLSGVPVIYIQHTGNGLVKGTPAWQIHPDIAPKRGDLVIEKKTPDAFHETDLQRALHGLGRRQVVLVGMQTELCVDTTCRRAFSLGYDTTLVQDGHSTFDSKDLNAAHIVAHHNTALGWFAAVKPAREITF